MLFTLCCYIHPALIIPRVTFWYANWKILTSTEIGPHGPQVLLPATWSQTQDTGTPRRKVIYLGVDFLSRWQAQALTTILTSQGRQRACIEGSWKKGIRDFGEVQFHIPALGCFGYSLSCVSVSGVLFCSRQILFLRIGCCRPGQPSGSAILL